MYYAIAFIAGVIAGFLVGYLYGGKAAKGLKDTVDGIEKKRG